MRRVAQRNSLGLLVSSIIVVLGLLSRAVDVRAQDVVYNRDVRAILAENCFSCHGFDQKTREAGLRLDTADGSKTVLESGSAAIVPGKPDESELLNRIFSNDHSTLMPPPESGKQLTPKQKNILKTWFAQGAEYQKHWAFIPPAKTEPPTSENSDAVQHNEVDAFIQDRLKQAGLAPSSAADPVTLMRRVSLDLTGLPPSIAEGRYVPEKPSDRIQKVPTATSSIGFCKVLTTANAGDAGGLIRLVTPTAMATPSMPREASGNIATGSLTR